MEMYITGYNSYTPSEFKMEKVSARNNKSYRLGQLTMDRDSAFFPGRSDEKVMRSDVKMAIVAMREMLEQLKLSQSEIEKASLFVANGAFLEDSNKNLDRTLAVYQSFPKGSSLQVKLKKLYRSSPPLLAIETLTNSAMSFIAQYVGLKGNNTTYGNTSLSTIHCLQNAEIDLKTDKVKNVFVCATNCSGNHSFIMNSGINPIGKEWKESAAGGCLSLVESKTGKHDFVGMITDIRYLTNVPSLIMTNKERNWESILPKTTSDLLIFSGAFHEDDNKKDRNYCESIHHNVETLFEKFGNTGPANIILGIIYGIESFSENIQCVDIVDRDLYGRESLIRIKIC